jgi:hypothetical protein
MARYIKANPKVAKFLNLESDRNTVKDGNYLLWQADMLAFGPLTQLANTLQQIGGIALLPHEAREEQDGTVTRPLPQATDPRFIVEPVEPETEVPGEENEPTGSETNAGESETDGQQAEGDTPDTSTDANSETPAEETAQSNDEVESIDSGDVGSVDEVLNANDKEE